MQGKPDTPSAMLLGVAASLHALERAPRADTEVNDWMYSADERLAARLNDLAPEDVAPWTLSASDLLARPMVAAVSVWPPEAPRDFESFLALVGALQLLDAWHKPLCGQLDGRVWPRNEDHRTAWDRLAERGALAADG